jgi:Ca2+/Na+ antiporter
MSCTNHAIRQTWLFFLRFQIHLRCGRYRCTIFFFTSLFLFLFFFILMLLIHVWNVILLMVTLSVLTFVVYDQTRDWSIARASTERLTRLGFRLDVSYFVLVRQRLTNFFGCCDCCKSKQTRAYRDSFTSATTACTFVLEMDPEQQRLRRLNDHLTQTLGEIVIAYAVPPSILDLERDDLEQVFVRSGLVSLKLGYESNDGKRLWSVAYRDGSMFIDCPIIIASEIVAGSVNERCLFFFPSPVADDEHNKDCQPTSASGKYAKRRLQLRKNADFFLRFNEMFRLSPTSTDTVASQSSAECARHHHLLHEKDLEPELENKDIFASKILLPVPVAAVSSVVFANFASVLTRSPCIRQHLSPATLLTISVHDCSTFTYPKKPESCAFMSSLHTHTHIHTKVYSVSLNGVLHSCSHSHKLFTVIHAHTDLLQRGFVWCDAKILRLPRRAGHHCLLLPFANSLRTLHVNTCTTIARV